VQNVGYSIVVIALSISGAQVCKLMDDFLAANNYCIALYWIGLNFAFGRYR